jgi:hypothetical protein
MSTFSDRYDYGDCISFSCFYPPEFDTLIRKDDQREFYIIIIGYRNAHRELIDHYFKKYLGLTKAYESIHTKIKFDSVIKTDVKSFIDFKLARPLSFTGSENEESISRTQSLCDYCTLEPVQLDNTCTSKLFKGIWTGLDYDFYTIRAEKKQTLLAQLSEANALQIKVKLSLKTIDLYKCRIDDIFNLKI